MDPRLQLGGDARDAFMTGISDQHPPPIDQPAGPLSPQRRTRRRRTLITLGIIGLVVAAVVAVGVTRLAIGDDSAPKATVAPTQGLAPGAKATGNATFDEPDGFTRGARFRPASPLYTPFGGTYFVPKSVAGTVQVVAVLIYTLPSAVPDTDAGRLSFVSAVDRRVKAQVTRASSATTVGGQPAVTQDGLQPVSSGGVTQSYPYRTWYVFRGPSTLVQVACQWSSQRETILKGCGQLLRSVAIK